MGTMSQRAFETLDVYRLSETLADQVWKTVLTWSSFEKATVGMQVVRAADSVGANIAEGFGRGTGKDNSRFIRIARGSLNETIHWMRRAYCRNLLKESEVLQIKTLVDELSPRLNAYLRSVSRSNRPAGGTRMIETTNNKQRSTNKKEKEINRQ